MSSVGAIGAVGSAGSAASVAAVRARIGQIEQRLGVRRTLPVQASAPAATTATTAGTSASGVSVASAAAAVAADPTASFAELLGVDPATVASGAPTAAATTSMGTTSTGTTATGTTSFDQAFDAAVAELQAQWTQPATGATTASTGVSTSPVSPGSPVSTVSTVSTVASSSPGVEGAVSTSTPYAAEFEAAGARYGVPPKVLAAIGYVESRFRTDAISSAGAVGMMQFLPTTAASMGVDPSDPASAIDGAARYLRSALDRFGSIEAAIASYNVGPGTIARAGGVLPGSQAERYLDKVLDATGRI